MSRTLKLIGFLTVLLALVVIVTGLAVYRLVRVGEVHRFLTAEIEKQTGLQTRFGGAELELGWITGIAFSDLALSEPGAAEPALTSQRVTARIALLPLLRRQLVFYEIHLRQPAAQFVRERDGHVPLLDRLLNLPFFNDHTSQFAFDVRSIQVREGNVTLINHRREGGPDTWRAGSLDLEIERAGGASLSASFKNLLKREPGHAGEAALSFELKSDLHREGAKMALRAQGQLVFPQKILEFHQAQWDGDIELANVPARLITEYAGARLPVKSMDGYFAQRLHIEGNAATLLRAKGVFEFRQLAIEAPELLLGPLRGLDGRATFAIERTPRELQLIQGDLRVQDVHLSLQGNVAALDGNDPSVRLTLSALPAPATALIRYLPLKLFGSPRLEEAAGAIQGGQLEVKKVAIQSTLSELRRPETAVKQISLAAELRDFAGQFGAALPLRGVQGKINFIDGILTLTDLRGAYGDSRFNRVDATYDWAGAAPGKLEVEAHGDVNLAELREEIRAQQSSEKLDKVLSSVEDLSGRGKVDVSVKRTPDAPLQFDGKVALEQTRLRYGGVLLSEIRGDVGLTSNEITGERIRAQFAGSPLQARFVLKDYAGEDGVFDLGIDSPGVRAGVLAKLLLDTGSPQDPGIVRGTVRYFGALNDSKRRKFTGDLDLVNVQLLFSPLLQPLRELNGKVKIDENGIDFQNLKALLVGFPASASGRWRYTGSPQLVFDFVAPNLDITYLISQLDPESSAFYANLVAAGKIALAKGRIKNFEFGELRTEATIDHRVWRLTNLSARSVGGTIQGVTTIFDRPETLGVAAEPKMQGVPVQSFLRWFDVTTTEMSGRVNLAGKLETAGRNDVDRRRNLNGAFNLKIEDGTIHRMRILVQILNLLDLSRWFTFQFPDLAKDGIRFRAITGDFKVVKGVYSTENLVVDSTDLRMTGAGKIDVPKDELDFVVAVRPFAGIDTALNYIPLIGRGVAAIKNSFLVASFNIQGPIDNPTITPAPLGTLTEWFWGVLGIPKNMIGLGEGETKEETAPKPPAE
jgi:uncharacterized protein YhdP